MKKLALVTLVVLGVLISGLAVYRMHEAVQALMLALAIGAALEPAVANLVRRGLKRAHAVLLGVGLLVVVALGWVVLFAARLAVEVPTLIEDLPTWYDSALITLYSSGQWALRLGEVLPTTEELAAALLSTRLTELGSILFARAGEAFTLFTFLIVVFTLGLYWLIDQPRIERLWLSLLPFEARGAVRRLWKRVFDEVGLYVRLVIFSVLLTSLVLLFIYSFLRLPGAAILALFGGLMQIVPLLGLPLAVVPAIVVALTQGPLVAAGTLVAGIAGVAFMRFILQRRLFPAVVAVNPVLVVVLIMALGELGGVWLILLAPPVAAALHVITKIVSEESKSWAPQLVPADVTALQAQVEAISARVTATQNGSDPLSALVAQTRSLVDEAGAVLPTSQSEQADEETPPVPFSGIEPAYIKT